MIFNSSIFLLCFLPLFLLAYFIIPQKLRNAWALIASLGFFAWGAPIFIFVALVALLFNFIITQRIHRDPSHRKVWLALSLLLSVGLLMYYKYTNFFIANINDALSAVGIGALRWTEVLLPMGISFITFHQVSYTLDVYRGERPPLRNPAHYALYVLFFPRLMAGPIIRYNEMADALADRRAHETVSDRLAGFFRFSAGLAKKVLVADVLAAHALQVFNAPVHELSTSVAWLGILAFTFQIYFDFSGYSDMAIGLGRMMGFRFPENFNNPYVATSITEFWRRWHITLSGFLKEYLYLPMAVALRDRGKIGVFIALLVTFTVCGMWHQAGWNFILWGALQGMLMILELMFMQKVLNKITRLPAMALTFFAVMMGWVLFQSADLSEAGAYYQKLFAFDHRWTDIATNTKFFIILAFAGITSFLGIFKKVERFQHTIFENKKNVLVQVFLTILSLALILLSVSAITAYGFNPFIYATF